MTTPPGWQGSKRTTTKRGMAANWRNEAIPRADKAAGIFGVIVGQRLDGDEAGYRKGANWPRGDFSSRRASERT